MLEEQDYKDRKGIAQLTSAYDTLKMLYFKDFKECSDDSPMVSPSFEKMAEALAPQNHNYTSWETESSKYIHICTISSNCIISPSFHISQFQHIIVVSSVLPIPYNTYLLPHSHYPISHSPRPLKTLSLLRSTHRCLLRRASFSVQPVFSSLQPLSCSQVFSSPSSSNFLTPQIKTPCLLHRTVLD